MKKRERIVPFPQKRLIVDPTLMPLRQYSVSAKVTRDLAEVSLKQTLEARIVSGLVNLFLRVISPSSSKFLLQSCEK